MKSRNVIITAVIALAIGAGGGSVLALKHHNDTAKEAMAMQEDAAMKKADAAKAMKGADTAAMMKQEAAAKAADAHTPTPSDAMMHDSTSMTGQ